MTKRYETALAEKKKEYDNLYYKKAMILKSYNEKIQQLKAKGEDIQELIEKAKAGADKGLVEILTKWEEANKKIFDKYPAEGEMDFSILEAAVTEMHKLEASQPESEVTQSIKNANNSNKKPSKKA